MKCVSRRGKCFVWKFSAHTADLVGQKIKYFPFVDNYHIFSLFMNGRLASRSRCSFECRLPSITFFLPCCRIQSRSFYSVIVDCRLNHPLLLNIDYHPAFSLYNCRMSPVLPPLLHYDRDFLPKSDEDQPRSRLQVPWQRSRPIGVTRLTASGALGNFVLFWDTFYSTLVLHIHFLDNHSWFTPDLTRIPDEPL